MKKFRYVDSPDHVDEFQCLNCKGYFLGDRYSAYPYCPCCGIKFEGQHECRERYLKRWEYDRFGLNGLPSHLRDLEHRIYKEQRDKENRCWIVESRTCFHNDKTGCEFEWSAWKYERKFKGNDCTAKNVIWYVKEYYHNRDEDWFKVEYRIRRNNEQNVVVLY